MRCWETVFGIWGSKDWVTGRVRVGSDIRYVRRSIMSAFGHACSSEVEERSRCRLVLCLVIRQSRGNGLGLFPWKVKIEEACTSKDLEERMNYAVEDCSFIWTVPFERLVSLTRL